MITAEEFDKYAAEATATTKPKAMHALTIVARLLKDKRVDDAKYITPGSDFTEVYTKYGDVIREYVGQWDTATAHPQEVSRKFEELVWMNVAIYGTCGFKKGGEFNNDFFM